MKYMLTQCTSVIKAKIGMTKKQNNGSMASIITIFVNLKLGIGVVLTFGILRKFRELIFIGAILFILSKLEWSIAEYKIKK